MEVLFHLFFELIKISILGTIYATLTLIIILVIGNYKSESWFARVSNRKLKSWFLFGFIISIGLFVFMFSYWGDHGLGDSARVPIGHFQAVNQINGVDTYIEVEKYDELEINDFTFDENNLFAEIRQEFSYEKGAYIKWDLITNEWTFYHSKKDFLMEAEEHNYPKPTKFKPFFEHYKRHWHGWRFWLLP